MNRKETRDNFITNVEKIRIEKGYTQTEFADLLDMSISGYRKMVAGETNTISLYSVYKVHELTGISITQLMGIEDKQSEIIQMYKQLSERQRNFVDAVIKFENGLKVEDSERHHICTLIVPTGEMKDGMDYDSCTYEKLDIGFYGDMYNDNLTFALKITSNFFAPAYLEDDILLIGNDRVPNIGEIGLYTCGGKVYLRRFIERNPLTLEPIVTIGKKIIVFKEELVNWNIIGYVIKKIRS